MSLGRGDAWIGVLVRCYTECNMDHQYLVEFNQLAECVQWGDAPLCRQLHNKFPSQIKDEISRVNKPNNPADLHILAPSIHACY